MDMGYDLHRCASSGIMARGAKELGKLFEQLQKLAVRQGLSWGEVAFSSDRISDMVLMALSDRLAAQLGSATLSCRVVDGRRGKLDADSVIKGSHVFVAAEMTEVEGKEVTVYLNRCTKVSVESLKKYFPDDFSEHDGAVYGEAARRVVRMREVTA